MWDYFIERGIFMTTAEKSAQKYIKKINQRMIDLVNYVGFDSTEYSKYQKALELSGIEYEFKQTKTAPQGVFVIANTKENRAKVNVLQNQIEKQQTKTKGDIKQKYREKVSKRKNKPRSEVTQEEIQEEKEKNTLWENLTANIDVLYRDSRNPDTLKLLEEFREKSNGVTSQEKENGVLDELVEKIHNRANEIGKEEQEYIEKKAFEIDSLREEETKQAELELENFHDKGVYPF